MSLFICDKCGVIENTALGAYWTKDLKEYVFADKSLRGLALCSLCAPDTYEDGTENDTGGKWHRKFPREFPDANRIKEIGLSNFVSSKRLTKLLEQESK